MILKFMFRQPALMLLILIGGLLYFAIKIVNKRDTQIVLLSSQVDSLGTALNFQNENARQLSVLIVKKNDSLRFDRESVRIQVEQIQEFQKLIIEVRKKATLDNLATIDEYEQKIKNSLQRKRGFLKFLKNE